MREWIICSMSVNLVWKGSSVLIESVETACSFGLFIDWNHSRLKVGMKLECVEKIPDIKLEHLQKMPITKPKIFKSFGSNGLRPSAKENSGNGPSNDQQKMKSSRDAGDGLDSPSKSQWPCQALTWNPTKKEKVRPPKKHLVPWSGGWNKEVLLYLETIWEAGPGSGFQESFCR